MLHSELMSFQDKVRERIQSTFADLIPKEQWDTLIAKGTRDFIDKELPSLIKAECANWFKARIAEELAKPEWITMWNGQGPMATDLVKALTKELAPDLISGMFSGLVANLVHNLRNQLANSNNGQRY